VTRNAFFAADGGPGSPEVEPDEQVRAEPDQLEEHERHQQVVGDDEAEHRRREQAEPGVVAGEPRLALVVHVPEREHVHEQRDERYDDEHERRQRVDENAEGELDVRRADPAGARPRVDGPIRRLAPRDRREYPQREQERARRRRDAAERAPFGEIFAGTERDQEREEREEYDRRNV